MTGDREKKLDELEQELSRPYIEKPDEFRADLGSACFLNAVRWCGPDCAAFVDADAPTAAERCLILSGVNTGLAMLGELVQLKRSKQAQPPSVPPPYINR